MVDNTCVQHIGCEFSTWCIEMQFVGVPEGPVNIYDIVDLHILLYVFNMYHVFETLG